MADCSQNIFPAVFTRVEGHPPWVSFRFLRHVQNIIPRKIRVYTITFQNIRNGLTLIGQSKSERLTVSALRCPHIDTLLYIPIHQYLGIIPSKLSPNPSPKRGGREGGRVRGYSVEKGRVTSSSCSALFLSLSLSLSLLRSLVDGRQELLSI